MENTHQDYPTIHHCKMSFFKCIFAIVGNDGTGKSSVSIILLI